MSDELAIKVDSVSKDFVLPHQKANTIKSLLISPFKRYDVEKQKALKDVSFEIRKGEFFGIVGRNGSGKSTLLKCMAGVYHPDKGSIGVNGTLVPFIELGVGFNPELSGRDNVYLNGALLGFSRPEIAAMYDEIVEFSELEKFMDQKLKNYSSGMQVRLAFSVAIQAKGDILLLDEVLAVGDSAFQRKCFNYFEKLKENKTTVILVTHDMSAVERFCSRAALLDDGKIVKISKASEVSDKYKSINVAHDTRNNEKKQKEEENVQILIKKQTNESIVFKMMHSKDDAHNYYFGFSVIRDGVTFAELNNMNASKAKIVNKSISYELDISNFNPGVYELSAALFKTNGRELVAFTQKRQQFVINGTDSNRGAALHLKDNWLSDTE